MDPAKLLADESALRGDPLVRARERMELGERFEQADRERQAVERREQLVHQAAVGASLRRSELAAQGFTNAEVARFHQEAEQRRAGRVVELRAELERLEGRPYRPPQASDVDRLLSRCDAEREAGQVVIARARALDRRIERRAEIAGLEQRLEEERQAERGQVARSGGAPRPRPTPPLAVPELAHRLPAGDW